MKCIMKTSDMIKQILSAASTGTATKMTIENFQKREDAIFTSHLSDIELETEVKCYFTTQARLCTSIITIIITITISH